MGTPRGELISEDAVRTASAKLYSDILGRACRNGWRYPRSQIENGLKRHLEELKLQLVDRGYTIVPNPTVNEPALQASRMTKRLLVASRQFGCFRLY